MNAAVGPRMSLRQQMEKHRADPMCASCHNKMDPLGFGLENYNAIGKWRTEDGKFPVDSSGTLPDGKTFQTPAEMRGAADGGAAAVRALPDREDADLCAGPRAAAVRPAARSTASTANWRPMVTVSRSLIYDIVHSAAVPDGRGEAVTGAGATRR